MRFSEPCRSGRVSAATELGKHPILHTTYHKDGMRLNVDILSQVLHSLWAHKLRSFLTMFGIAWGVGSLLLLVGLGEGFRSGNRKQFDELGEDVMFIWGGRAPAIDGSLHSLRQYYLTDRDYRDIDSQCTD